MRKRRQAVRTPPRVVARVAALVCALLLVLQAAPLLSEDRGRQLQLNLVAEYDDNVFLKGDDDTSRRGEVVLRLDPQVRLAHDFRDHVMSFGLTGSYARGTQTATERTNLSATGAVDLSFPGGLRLGARDSYVRSRLDQALHDEAGTPDSDTNTLELSAAYAPGERLRVEAGGERSRQSFSEVAGFGEVDRDTDTLHGGVTIPVRASLVATATFEWSEQRSRQRPERDYRDRTGMIGVRWSGPRRFSLWLQAGEQTVDIESPPGTTYRHAAGSLGAEVKFTESSRLALVVGRDGYERTTLLAELQVESERGFTLTATASRETQPSFSFLVASPLMAVTELRLRASRDFVQGLRLTLEASSFTYATVLSAEHHEDRVWTARAGLSYAISEWLRLEGSALLTRRDASLDGHDFDNRRYGLSAGVRL